MTQRAIALIVFLALFAAALGCINAKATNNGLPLVASAAPVCPRVFVGHPCSRMDCTRRIA